MALKALRDNLFVVRTVDGRHFLAILDDRCYIDPMEIIPQQYQDEADGVTKIKFTLAMSYIAEPLCDPIRAKDMNLPQSATAIRFEHVMAYSPANDAAANMYFETKDRILEMRMNAALEAQRRMSAAKSADGAEDAAQDKPADDTEKPKATKHHLNKKPEDTVQ